MKANLQIKDESYLNRSSRNTPIIVGRTARIGSLELVWWGLAQIHKWRWHKSHIDLGALSIYGFRYNHWFWQIVAILVKPLRWNYNRRFKHTEHLGKDSFK